MRKQEFIEKYGDYLVKFDYYYKYTFTFTAELDDNKKIVVNTGGNHDEIYRDDVSAGTAYKVSDLNPYSGDVYQEKDTIDTFYDY